MININVVQTISTAVNGIAIIVVHLHMTVESLYQLSNTTARQPVLRASPSVVGQCTE